MSEKAATARRKTAVPYNPEIASAICEWLADGNSLRAFSAQPDTPNKGSVMRWLAEREDFRKAYALARQMQTDNLVDGAVDEVRETKDVQQARVVLDAVKWQVGMLAPQKYGTQRVAVDNSATLPGLSWMTKPQEEWDAGERLEFARRSTFAINTILQKVLAGDALKPDGNGILEGLVEQVRAQRATRATPVAAPPRPPSAAPSERPGPSPPARPTPVPAPAPTLVPTKSEVENHLKPERDGVSLVVTPIERMAILRARQIAAVRQQEAARTVPVDGDEDKPYCP